MLIVCPNCAKSYHIARGSIGNEGRAVQCSMCFSRWICVAPNEAEGPLLGSDDRSSSRGERTGEGRTPTIAGEVTASQAAAPPVRSSPLPPRDAAVHPSPRVSASRMPMFQLGAAAAVIAAAMGAVAARQAIVARAPALGYLYASIGLPVNVRGIAFTDVKSALAQDGFATVLSVEGKLANLRATTVKVPEIVAALKGPDGRDLYTWTAPAPKATLAPGEIASFRTRLAAPPENGRDVVLRFASADDVSVTVPRAGR
jgi:predicted Zn finger-like uncharacterized protein